MSSMVTSLIGFLLISIAIACIAIAVFVYKVQARQEAERVLAQGEVIDLKRRSVRAGRPGTYCPVVRFHTSAGQVIQFESKFGTLPASHQIGQTIPVLYDPSDPQQAEISTSLSRWTVPLTFALFGATVLCTGSLLLLPRLLRSVVSP